MLCSIVPWCYTRYNCPPCLSEKRGTNKGYRFRRNTGTAEHGPSKGRLRHHLLLNRPTPTQRTSDRHSHQHTTSSTHRMRARAVPPARRSPPPSGRAVAFTSSSNPMKWAACPGLIAASVRGSRWASRGQHAPSGRPLPHRHTPHDLPIEGPRQVDPTATNRGRGRGGGGSTSLRRMEAGPRTTPSR